MSVLPERATCSSIRNFRRPSQRPESRSLATRLGAFLAALVFAMPAVARAEWVGEAIDLMGTRVSVELWHDDAAAGRALVEAVLDEYRRIDREMSTYKPESPISRVNAEAASQPVPVSRELLDLVGRALELSDLSGGAFDITYDSVGFLYDFRARRRPSDEEIGSRLSAIDWRHVVLDRDASTIRFSQPGVRINLGGIAKGYAVERGAAILREHGVRHAVLNAGGDTRVVGDRRGQPWIVGIRHPRLDDEIVTRLPLVDEAVSTSGDYERYFEEDGRRYHHILNPATGRPTEGVLSVTVIGPDATMTDGLSTTLFVLGVEEGLELIERLPGYEAVIVTADGKLSYSSGLAPPSGE
ncbi:MAG: FAD:protein FMN transferase [Gammaproteobacteria bacterium]|nr:thiamine biosynthesis protein ApbE [Gammaproteobacteria bacterium]